MNKKKGKKIPKKMSKKIPQKKVENPNVPKEWLYLAPEGVTLRVIYEEAGACESWKAEFWEEAGALEIALPEAGSVDMEEIDIEEEDRELFSYRKEKGAGKVYAVTIRPEYWEKARGVMEYLTEKLGGFFCGDTEGFWPEVRKEG